MKPGLVKLIAAISLLLAMMACSKQPLERIPVPDDPQQGPAPKGAVAFIVNQSLNGAPYHSSNLTAVVTVVNQQNVAVAESKTLTLNLDGTIKSEVLQLPHGTYKLTGFRLVYGGVNTHFAAPLTGSPKASGVQKPLALEFTVPAADGVVPVEVINVAAGEGPQHFGYPSGSFDNHQEENDPYMKIKIKASMQIGDVLYDSVAASLVLTTWDLQGQMATAYLALKAGINRVPVPKAASKYRLTVSKWGTTDEMTLNRNQVDTVTVYSLGGSKEAKKLTSEITSVLVDGRYVGESKIEYHYSADGRLSKVNHLKRDIANGPYVDMVESFQYSGGRVAKIERVNGKNKPLGITTFAYDQQGKVARMVLDEDNLQISATVSYHYGSQPGATIHYTYSDQTYTTDYSFNYSRGNIQSSEHLIEGRLSQISRYEFDGEINPYVHLNWPDLSLSRLTKNNLVTQTNQYVIQMPQLEPYDLVYTYDADGYPKEVVKKWRTLPERKFVKTTRTVFAY